MTNLRNILIVILATSLCGCSLATKKEVEALGVRLDGVESQTATALADVGSRLTGLESRTGSLRGMILRSYSSESGAPFQGGRSALSARAQDYLRSKGKLLLDDPSLTATVTGYASTDCPRGTVGKLCDGKNRQLAWERAGEAKAFLVKMGVEATRLKTLGLTQFPTGNNTWDRSVQVRFDF